MSSHEDGIPLSMIVTGCVTCLLASTLAFVTMTRNTKSNDEFGKTNATTGGGSQHTTGSNTEDQIAELDPTLYPGGHLTVYYGSQTGTAESFAQQIEREGSEKGFMVHVVDLEDVSMEDFLQEDKRDKETGTTKAVFIVATYGEGEPTDNSAQMVQAIKELTAPVSEDQAEEEKKDIQSTKVLDGLEYCVFGLGNRQYEHYNAMGKFFDSAIEQLGGKRVIKIGLGDDDADLEGDFDTWKEEVLWPKLGKRYIKDDKAAAELKQKAKQQKNVLPDCAYALNIHDDDGKGTKPSDIPIEKVHGSSRHYFTAQDCPVSVVRELRSNGASGSTVHMEIDISKTSLQYQTADNMGVLPMNRSEVVESVAHGLGFDLEQVFSLSAADGHEWHGAPFPMPISVRECLTRYCDLTIAPRRSDLKLLASYATDDIDKKALMRMASKEGKAEYREKIMDGHVGFIDLLRLCPSIQMSLEHFLSLCPRLLPRYYTISSSSSVHPKSVHLTVAVTETQRRDGTVFQGVCSSYLAGTKKTSDMVRVFCRDSTFRLDKDSTRPIILIGPGTGIAPMRALLQERLHQKEQLKLPIGPNVLYFGCKKRTEDYLYKEELEEFQKKKILDQLYVAFSREQADKVYVQNLLSKNATETWDLIHNKTASIYVCGGVRMGNDVHETLKTICRDEGGMSATDANEYMSGLAKEGRFVQELWA